MKNKIRTKIRNQVCKKVDDRVRKHDRVKKHVWQIGDQVSDIIKLIVWIQVVDMVYLEIENEI